MKWQFWIDRGGTFTDVVSRDPQGRLSAAKVLSERPGEAGDPAVAGIRHMLGIALGQAIPDGLIDIVKMGTTVATNALLQRRGEPVLLVVNTGFADVLRIGNQARPRLFELSIVRPEPLYAEVAEIAGRVAADGHDVAPIDEVAASAMFASAAARGLTSCAIALMHAWKFPAHEQRLAELARAAGFSQVSASHAVSPLMRLIPRAQTAVMDAYLSPVLRRAVERTAKELHGTRLFFMQSHGGLIESAGFTGKGAVLSGPAGGIVGAARTADMAGMRRIISFDMGGTSTDVALYAGRLALRSAGEIAGLPIQAPMLDIHTVAAGGGSVLRFDGARLRVGPESAGAQPGPAGYGAGGPLTITDANICMGKLQPAHFPAIFGPAGDAPLDADVVRDAFSALATEIGRAQDLRGVAEGFIRVAVANMANAIRNISVRRGEDVSRFALHCFGGAAGQHACLVADELGMAEVLIHPLAGVLSAFGMGLADQATLREQAVEQDLTEGLLPEVRRMAEGLAGEARAALLAQGADEAQLRVECRVHLRHRGTDTALAVPFGTIAAMTADFASAHQARFGFAGPGHELVVEALAVEVTQPGEALVEPVMARRETDGPRAIDQVEIWSGGRVHATPVFDREGLAAGDGLTGPALIREANTTTIVEPGWRAEVTARNDMILRRITGRKTLETSATGPADPVLLELFNNLFMNIAEQAGAVLQNLAMSVNIRERLDFSCAIFDFEGHLIANAPHVPVHLGAMGESVKTILRTRRTSLRPGDAIALNHPANGGTHLPDITVVTPVFSPDGSELRLFVACRGHHADVGGTAPGSTPPFSRTLEEEGTVIDDFLLVRDGTFREAAFRELLSTARYPARTPDMNVADIKAQIASNEKSAQELQSAIAHWGWETVRAYTGHVLDNGEDSIRRVIARLQDGRFTTTLDDGTALHVAVRIDQAARSAVVDFSGTGKPSKSNFNAPRAVTRAVVLYVFRCLANDDIPLNDGCLRPVTLIIPDDSFLSPGPDAAVVAGNTEVSQIVCNALLGALGVCASSQATMNNFLFGHAGLQYYETICGGTGAGKDFDGESAVQTHMTNTRMTDPEVLETRYPVRVEEFSIRHGSGGDGRRRGGDGAIRRLRFFEPMTATIVASRRAVAPFGLAGGGDGAPGAQWVERTDGTRETLEACSSVDVKAGDVFGIATPGGGGFGEKEGLLF